MFHTLFRSLNFIVIVFALLLSARTSFARVNPTPTPTPTATPVPLAWGTTLPEPPQQKSAWSPSLDLPTEFASLAQMLFEQGMADPRGGDYRNIEVVRSSTWGNPRVHGWVLPSSSAQKFAVCWNGWVYPLVSVGAPADLRTDVMELLNHPERQTVSRSRRELNIVSYRIGTQSAVNIVPPADPLSPNEKGFSPVKACLLARLGQNDLAAKVWAAWQKALNDAPANAQSVRDPYLALAGDWTEALFSRVACAHERADDRLVLLDTDILTALQPIVEAEAAKRGFKKNEYSHVFPRLTFFQEVLGLSNDAKQRLGLLPAIPSAKNTLKAQQVVALIKNLDEVRAGQRKNPGGIQWNDDEHVRALAKVGEDAIEPLIDAYANDRRLTRRAPSVFSRDSEDNWQFLHINQIEHSLLINLLKTAAFERGQDSYSYNRKYPTGQEYVDQLRAYWKEYGGMPPAERWYQILKDDKWGSDAWRQAAANIVTPLNVSIAPNNNGWVSFAARALKRGEKPQFKGEKLRDKANPSVAELLARRVDDISKIEEVTTATRSSRARACEVAFYLSSWDAEAAVPVLQLATQRYLEYLSRSKSYSSPDETTLQPLMLRLFLARVRGNDATAFADYQEWLSKNKPTKALWGGADNLEVLWQAPDNELVQVAGEWLLNNPASPLQLWLKNDPLVSDSFGFNSSLWLAPSFKSYLLRKLGDTRPLGTVLLQKNAKGQNEWLIRLPNNSYTPQAPPDSLRFSSGSPVPFRVCDYYAWQLWYYTGVFNRREVRKPAPRFELYWPQEKRDALLHKSMKFVNAFQLKRDGVRY